MSTTELTPMLSQVVESIKQGLPGTSLKHIADITGLTVSHLHKLRHKWGNPTLDTLALLADYFDRHPDPVKLPVGRKTMQAKPKPDPAPNRAPWD